MNRTRITSSRLSMICPSEPSTTFSEKPTKARGLAMRTAPGHVPKPRDREEQHQRQGQTVQAHAAQADEQAAAERGLALAAGRHGEVELPLGQGPSRRLGRWARVGGSDGRGGASAAFGR